MIWRVVMREKATLQEIEKHWDLNDLYDANEALDIVDEADFLASQKP